jgi:hypothetical protein
MPTKKDHLLELLTNAGCPLISLFGPDDGPSDQISYSHQPQMTVEQHQQAQAIINAFDWSDAAHAAWLLLAERLLHIDEINHIQNMTTRSVVKLSVDQFNLIREEVVGVVTQVWDPANIANGAGLTSPAVTVPGVQFGDEVSVAAPYSLQGLLACASVQSAGANGTVVVRLHNATGAGVNLGSGTWKVVVYRTVARQPILMSQAKAAIVADVASGSVDS